MCILLEYPTSENYPHYDPLVNKATRPSLIEQPYIVAKPEFESIWVFLSALEFSNGTHVLGSTVF